MKDDFDFWERELPRVLEQARYMAGTKRTSFQEDASTLIKICIDVRIKALQASP